MNQVAKTTWFAIAVLALIILVTLVLKFW